jgi:signal transduction histidine kinase/CheY-like chemotaxis protein
LERRLAVASRLCTRITAVGRSVTELGDFVRLRELAMRSALTAPMLANGQLVGAITLGRGSERPRYGNGDLALAEDIARRVGIAVLQGRLYEQARQAVSLREDLLGIVAHDLRNPLAGLLMRCSLLLETLPKDETGSSVRRDVEAMRRSAHRMEALLRELLDFARIRAGRLALQRQPAAANELLREAFESVPPLAGNRKVEIQNDLGTDEPTLHCDSESFLQIFSNLIMNAIKFTKPDGHIVIRCEQANGELRITVRDDGPGIAPDELANLFQKFWQKRPQRAGVGLGLSIAKSLVEAQGGRIWAQSALGAGSTFGFALPIIGGELTDATSAATILIVDDDSAFRGELASMLCAHGFAVAEAADGRQALQYLASHAHPALVLTDLMMPVMDGWELAATVRSRSEFATVQLVAMSSLDRAQVGASLAGFASYVTKPPRLQQLLELLASHLG